MDQEGSRCQRPNTDPLVNGGSNRAPPFQGSVFSPPVLTPERSWVRVSVVVGLPDRCRFRQRCHARLPRSAGRVWSNRSAGVINAT